MCTACQYGNLTKKPWQSEGKQPTLQSVTRPGQVVSADKLESNSKGFITQLKGLLTTKHYQYATVFVGHYS